MTPSLRHRLVLVGGGHAHVQVLRRLSMRPLEDAHVTLVVDDPIAVYSGMVPGFVAGQYQREELEIDVRPLARRAGAAVIVARATGVDASERRIALEAREAIAYDTASFDVGSKVAGLDLPGVRAHALATRPIGRFVAEVDAAIARARGAAAPRVVVCGAGAGGLELAFALRARLAQQGAPDAAVTLVDAASELLPAFAAGVAERVLDALRVRNIELRLGTRVVAAHADALEIEGADPIPFDALIWATGAASLPLFRESGLALDARGFVRVRTTLQVEENGSLFASGDCAHFEPELPKAGVYAVRQGPLLDHNLRARVLGEPLRDYRPQRDSLVLLNLGDFTAIGTKWGRTLEGPRVFALKDHIDRRFVRRFQVLDADGESTHDFPEMEASAEMVCGGCAAKVGEPVLHRALARIGVRRDDAVVLGLEAPDDAAAVRTPHGELIVASIDGFGVASPVSNICAVDTFSYDIGNKIDPRMSINAADGFTGIRVTERSSTGGVDPEATLVAQQDFWSKLANGRQMPFGMRVGTAAGNMWAIHAPAVQYTGLAYKDRNGLAALDAALQFNRLNGDDEILLYAC